MKIDCRRLYFSILKANLVYTKAVERAFIACTYSIHYNIASGKTWGIKENSNMSFLISQCAHMLPPLLQNMFLYRNMKNHPIITYTSYPFLSGALV